MKPLWAIALGWILLALRADVNGFDLYADPLGWLLVMLGVRQLPGAFPSRAALLGLGGIAGTTAVLLWLPSVDAWLRDQEPAVGWAVNLPQFGWLALFCWAAATAARAGGELVPAAWFRTLLAVAVGIVVLPVLVFGAGITALDGLASVLVLLGPVVFVGVLFWYGTRPWADPVQAAAERSS